MISRSRIEAAALLASLGGASAIPGSMFPGPELSEAPSLGLHLVLTGVYFAAVIAFAGYRWGGRTWRAAGCGFLGTWIGWELAVNLALQMDSRWLKPWALAEAQSLMVDGFAAGAVGAVSTWAGLALAVPRLQRASVLVVVALAGAGLGTLLTLTNNYDSALVLLLPWQTAIAGILGFSLDGASWPEAKAVAASE